MSPSRPSSISLVLWLFGMDKLHFYFFHDVFLNFHPSLMFQYHIASNYYISLLWGVLTELQVVVACFSAPPKIFSGSATVSSDTIIRV